MDNGSHRSTGEKEKENNIKFKKIIDENFQNLIFKIKTSSKNLTKSKSIKSKRLTPRHILIKLLKANEKEPWREQEKNDS